MTLSGPVSRLKAQHNAVDAPMATYKRFAACWSPNRTGSIQRITASDARPAQRVNSTIDAPPRMCGVDSWCCCLKGCRTARG
jgi:hypothetical protein